MKIIVVPDLHGKTVWKQIEPLNYDKIVYIGDYLDSWTATNQEIENNLLDIIELKKKYPDKVILLLGNHELSYSFYPNFRCAGFRPEARPTLEHILNENKKLYYFF